MSASSPARLVDPLGEQEAPSSKPSADSARVGGPRGSTARACGWLHRRGWVRPERRSDRGDRHRAGPAHRHSVRMPGGRHAATSSAAEQRQHRAAPTRRAADRPPSRSARMNPLPLTDVFGEYTATQETPSPGDEPTRLTIRVEAVPSRWRALRWWAGVLVAIAAAAAGGKLVDSRRSSTRYHQQRPASRMVISGRSPSVEPQLRHRSARHPASHAVRPKHPQHRASRRIRHWAIFQRGRPVPSPPVAPASVESPAAPQAERPVPTRREAPAGQFSYLGR
jgi:hypothetical protein